MFVRKTTSQILFILLQNCKSIKHLIQVHTQIIVNGFSQKNYILAQLVSLYIAWGDVLKAQSIFSHTQNPSTSLWNQIIRTHARSDIPRKSVELFNRMTASEAVPDGFTYSTVLSACARSGLRKEGQQIHGRVLTNGLCSNVFVQTNLLNLYATCKMVDGIGNACRVFDEMSVRHTASWNSMLSAFVSCRDFDNARRLFDEMPERNAISYTNMISGFAQNGKCKLALLLFNEMERANVQMDQMVLAAALSACAELGDLKLGKRIHSYVDRAMRSGDQVLVSVQNALIHMYASCALIDCAYEIFVGMHPKSLVSWTSMIFGFAKQGRAEEALSIFKRMQEENVVRPDEITFIGALSACSHGGFVDEGRHVFKLMIQRYGIKPRIEHYGCMVDLLSRSGSLDEAHKLIRTMPMKPNYAVWGALLGGCRIHKNADLASHVAQTCVPELNSDHAAGYFVLLTNIYAAARRWSEVAKVREMMFKMGVKKSAGRSWVQINGTVHNFMAGDKTHKHSSSIYEMLGLITGQAKLEVFELETS